MGKQAEGPEFLTYIEVRAERRARLQTLKKERAERIANEAKTIPKEPKTPKLRPYTEREIEEIKYWEDKYKENEENYDILTKTKVYKGVKIAPKKQNDITNTLLSNRSNFIQYIRKAKAQPQIDLWVKEIKRARKDGALTKKEAETIIYGTENGMQNDFELSRPDIYPKYDTTNQEPDVAKPKIAKPIPKTPKLTNYILSNPIITKAQQKKIKSFDDDLLSIKNNIKTQHDKEEIKHLRAYFKTVQSKKNEYLKSIDNVIQPKPKVAKPKIAKPKNIMKGRSDLIGNKITTGLNIKKGLQPKVQRALKKSIIAELESKMKGGRIRTISLSDSDSD